MDLPYISTTTQMTGWLGTHNTTIAHHGRPALPHSMAVTILFGLAAGIISLVTIFGNTIVILSFFLEQSIRQPTNYFIASLALSDLLIGAVSMPFYTLYLLTGQYWPLNEFLCNVWLTVDYTACMCSIYTVFSITVDRYCSVKIPAKYRIWRTKRKVMVVIACIWAVSVLLFFSSIFLWQTWISDRKLEVGKCYVFYLEDALFNCSVQIGYFWITIMAMITLYIAIYRVALDLQRKSEEKHRKTAAVVTQINASTIRTALVKSEIEGMDSMENSQVKAKTPSPTETIRLLDKRFFSSDHKDHGSIKQLCNEHFVPAHRNEPRNDNEPTTFHTFASTDQKEGNCENSSFCQNLFPTLKSHENLNDSPLQQVINLDSFNERTNESFRVTPDVEFKETVPVKSNVFLKQSFSIDFRPVLKESSFEISAKLIPIKSWSFDGILESLVKNKIKQEKFKRFLKEKQFSQNSEKKPSALENSKHSIQFAANDSSLAETNKRPDLTLIQHISVQLSRATEMTSLNIKKFSTPQMGDIGRKLVSKFSISTVFRNIRVPDTLHELLQSRNFESQMPEASNAFNNMNNMAAEDAFISQRKSEEKLISCAVNCERENVHANSTTTHKKSQDFHDTTNLLNSFENELNNVYNSVDIRSQPEHLNNSRLEYENETKTLPNQTTLDLPPPPPTSNCMVTVTENQQALPVTTTVLTSWQTSTNVTSECLTAVNNESQCARSPEKSMLSNSAATSRIPVGEFIRLPFSREENKRTSGTQQAQSGAYTSHQKHKRANRARKALRTITIILGAFIVCFLPWHVLSMIMGFCPKNMICVSPMLYDISYWLCYLNSPINPFCYALANEQFKRTFARILRFDWHRI